MSALQSAKAQLEQERMKTRDLGRQLEQMSARLRTAQREVEAVKYDHSATKNELNRIQDEKDSLSNRLKGTEDDFARFRLETATEINSLRESLDIYRGFGGQSITGPSGDDMPIKREELDMPWPQMELERKHKAQSNTLDEPRTRTSGNRFVLSEASDAVEFTRVANCARSAPRGVLRGQFKLGPPIPRVTVQAPAPDLSSSRNFDLNEYSSRADDVSYVRFTSKSTTRTSTSSARENWEVLRSVSVIDNPRPDSPVASIVPECRMERHKWYKAGSNGSARKYRCTNCGFATQEWKRGGYWKDSPY